MRSETSVLSHVLFTALMAILLSLSPACGGGGSGTPSGVDSESESEAEAEGQEAEAEGDEAEAEAESESEAEAEAEAEAESESESECELEDCDDDVDCTDDSVDREICACAHELDHAFCFLQDEGSICDARDGCVTPQVICNSNADCPNLVGGCLIGSCDLSVASCQYEPRDLDHDGHAVQTCDKIGGDDCNDTDASIHPGATEVCDGLDNDCDSVTDGMSEPCGTDVGVCTIGTQTCTDGEWSSCSGVGSWEEWCNDLDDDCDGMMDEGCDDDEDGWCDSAMGVSVGPLAVCPLGDRDCDDTRAEVHPTALEICNDLDDNCNRSVDEGCDNDNDGFCDSDMAMGSSGASACWRLTPAGSLFGNDCNDTNAAIHPCILDVWDECPDELCDGIDNDCSGAVDDTLYEVQGSWGQYRVPGDSCDGDDDDECEDGEWVCASTTRVRCNDTTDDNWEECNGIDDDCDGLIDEGCNGDPTPSYDASNGSAPDAGVDAGHDASGCPGDCDDENACTTDTCEASSCRHVAVDVDDRNSCTIDACDPATGASHAPIGDVTANIDGDSIVGNNTGVPDNIDSSCASFGGNPGGELIYSITPFSTTQLVASLAGSGVSDTMLSVRTDCLNNDSEVACADDTFGLGLQSAVGWTAIAGTTYFLVVEPWATDEEGSFTLSIVTVACGDGVCAQGEDDTACSQDCGCAGASSCDGSAPVGCFCDAGCVISRDCCADACVQCGACDP